MCSLSSYIAVKTGHVTNFKVADVVLLVNVRISWTEHTKTEEVLARNYKDTSHFSRKRIAEILWTHDEERRFGEVNSQEALKAREAE